MKKGLLGRIEYVAMWPFGLLEIIENVTGFCAVNIDGLVCVCETEEDFKEVKAKYYLYEMADDYYIATIERKSLEV